MQKIQEVHADDLQGFIIKLIESGNCKVKLSIDACGDKFLKKAITTVQIIETASR